MHTCGERGVEETPVSSRRRRNRGSSGTRRSSRSSGTRLLRHLRGRWRTRRVSGLRWWWRSCRRMPLRNLASRSSRRTRRRPPQKMSRQDEYGRGGKHAQNRLTGSPRWFTSTNRNPRSIKPLAGLVSNTRRASRSSSGRSSGRSRGDERGGRVRRRIRGVGRAGTRRGRRQIGRASCRERVLRLV